MVTKGVHMEQLPPSIHRYEVGGGRVLSQLGGTCFHLDVNDGQRYSDAQIDDYHHDGHFGWRPPVQMIVRARFSHSQDGLKGTAGFGFWNDPFGMTKMGQCGHCLPRLRFPQAVWFFFASPPSDMALAMGVPGFGWKAATIDAGRARAKVLLPLAPLGMLACRWKWGYERIWPMAQHVLKIDESLLAVRMDEWHEYRLEWGREIVRFHVDGAERFCSRYAPRGPLGFVAWIDNQYMVATPQGLVGNGVIATDEEWMEMASLEILQG